MHKKIFIAANLLLLLIASLLTAGEMPSDNGKHLFILSGQSNMRGPLPDAFTESVSRVFGKENILIALVAHPGQPIKNWYKLWSPPADWVPKSGTTAPDTSANGHLYDQLLKTTKQKISGQKLASVTFIWMQGEADAMSGWGKVYEQSFYGILDQFKKDLELQKINFVIGRINDYWIPRRGVIDGDIMRDVQVKIGEANEYGDWVDTDDLNTGVNPWGGFEVDSGHFPNAAYRVLGQRFARKACKIIDPKRKLNDEFFDAAFFDSTENIKTHSAINKVITGTTPDSKYADENSGLGLLVDGKYGAIDQPDKQWLGFTSTPGGVEFVIDLGKSQNVSSVAVNILVDPALGAAIPKQVAIFVSKDGTTFEDRQGQSFKFNYSAAVRRMPTQKIDRRPLLLLAETNGGNGQYVKVKMESAQTWLIVDEIVINPVAKTQPFPLEAEHPRSKR